MKHRLMAAAVALFALAPATAHGGGSGAPDPGVGNVRQGTQDDSTYAASYRAYGVSNVFATTQRVSCYVPEVPAPGNVPCPGATTGENVGPYRQQATSILGYPAPGPMLVTDHSESDIRVDPTNPNHVIASSKWFTGAGGYNHLVGFYESWDGGRTWPVQGHVPGYEGFTDNTDPVGAFDMWGNYYEATLPYQFYYDKSGFKKYETGNEPNPGIDNEAVSVAVHRHGTTTADAWSTARGVQDNVFVTNSGLGQEPDKEWIAIDRKPRTEINGTTIRTYNQMYFTFVNFNGNGSKPYASTARAYADGTHSPWTTPVLLPTGNGATNNNTYLYPHVDPDGVVYTPVVTYASKQGSCCVDIYITYSSDGVNWHPALLAAAGVHTPPLTGAGYANTTFEDGIEETFAVGNNAIYLAYESKSSGFGNILLTASYDQGKNWTYPIQVNDNMDTSVDEFQPNLAVAADGTVSVNFYDRRLHCPTPGREATAAGIGLDTNNPIWGPAPPYGAPNYCITSSVQFYDRMLKPKGHNIRITEHSWDPQLNQPNRQCVCNPLDGFLGDYFGNDIAGSVDYATFVSTYNDGSNPQHYQQQVVAKISVPA